MNIAIREYNIEGVSTTLPFGSFVFEHEAFLTGRFDTHFVQNYYSQEKLLHKQKSNAEMAAIIALRYWLNKQKQTNPVVPMPTRWTHRRDD